ncbi:MAG: TonB-dependent receptor [Novosphingobium sp.]
MSRISKIAAVVLLGSTALSTAHAETLSQDSSAAAPQSAGAEPVADDIIVTGTRESGMKATDAAAPVTLLSSAAIEKVGQPNLNQALTQIVPSFQAQTQGTDMASFALSARLRGVSPNHTLVMVNGKRRHNSAIIQVIAGAFGGSVAPSIDLIPPDAVQRIEILQEGAAAQYGSDAIAGVINIILKSNDSGVTAKASAGQYYDSEGVQYSQSANIGVPMGDSGFVNLTLFHRSNDYTFLGDGQTSVRNLDGSTVTNISAAFRPIYDDLNARNGTAEINGGQPKSALSIGFINAGYDFNGVEAYAFGNIARRVGTAKQGYRPPNRICVNTAVPSTCFAPTVADGMVPLQKVVQDEYSLTGGLRGEVSGWDWDLSATYAADKNDIYTLESANTSLFRATGFTPRDFYNGAFEFTQFVGNLDLKHEFDIGFDDPMTFAAGAEYRHETYEIFAGDEASRFKEGGQSFPGYALSDAGKSDRDAYAIYGNVIVKPVPEWTVDIAGRFEDFSDFGSTTIGKLTSRYDFSDAFAIRGTASTGFRAPTLAESNYSATNVAPTSASVQLPPSSAAAVALGFGALKPEKSTNFSAGVVVRPIPRLAITLDGYYIKIKDRIASTGSITGIRNGVPVLTPLINGMTPFAAVSAAIAASGKDIDPSVNTISVQTFTNGIDTRTIGFDFSARYPVDLDFGNLDFTLSANYNETKVLSSNLGSLFNAQAEAILETSSPKFKAVFGTLFESGPFSANMRATYYAKSTVLSSPAITVASAPIPGNFYPAEVKPAAIVDLELGYDFTKWLNVAVGANNLFDKKPEIPALLPVAVASGTSPYINGSTTINSPFTHGPYGTNGGYYYARLTLNF